jgi:glucan phosphorylase
MATQSPSGSATDDAREQVQAKAEAAQEKLKGGAQQAQARMRDQVDQRSTQAGEQVSATAQALRTTSRQLREEGQDAQAQAAEKAAHHAERVGSYLSQSSADRILSDLEDFGRRQPMAVIGLGVGVGFLASRFLKASSRERYQARPPATGVQPVTVAAPPADGGYGV